MTLTRKQQILKFAGKYFEAKAQAVEALHAKNPVQLDAAKVAKHDYIDKMFSYVNIREKDNILSAMNDITTNKNSNCNQVTMLKYAQQEDMVGYTNCLDVQRSELEKEIDKYYIPNIGTLVDLGDDGILACSGDYFYDGVCHPQ